MPTKTFYQISSDENEYRIALHKTCAPLQLSFKLKFQLAIQTSHYQHTVHENRTMFQPSTWSEKLSFEW